MLTGYRNKTSFKVTIHALVWLLLLILPFIFSSHEPNDFTRTVKYSLIPMAFYAIIFYTNYIYLIDKLLFEKKIVVFITVNLCMIAVCVWTNFEIRQLLITVAPMRAPHPVRPMFIYKDIISMLIPVIVSIATKTTENWAKTEKEKTEKEKENLHSELQHLKYQLQPHFFFNSLNNIYYLVERSPAMAQEAIHSLAKLMRYMLYDTDTGKATLASEIEFMNQYINLMKLRMSDKTMVHTDFRNPAGEREIAPLLFISLIENAFKHGVSATHSSELFFKFTFENNTVTFTSENPNYPKSETDKSGSGIGLNNLRKRLDLLYPGNYIFETKIENDTFKTKLAVTIK
ncbi:MAG: sensor histidine kinase [Bacteroidia bacterium]